MEVVQYLDGVAASFFILALTEQTVGLHIMTRHWHGLHHMQTVTTVQTNTQEINNSYKTVYSSIYNFLYRQHRSM